MRNSILTLSSTTHTSEILAAGGRIIDDEGDTVKRFPECEALALGYDMDIDETGTSGYVLDLDGEPRIPSAVCNCLFILSSCSIRQ
jgi:hypothetical protein